MNTIKLSNNYRLPNIGYGTFESIDGNETEEKIIEAIKCGYRLIDTASIYNNSKSIGNTIKKLRNIIPRKDIFISSKISNEERSIAEGGYDATLKAFDNLLNKLSVDYLDSYLIHWPVPRNMERCYQQLNIETWKAFEKLYKEGKIKSIGVSNFLIRHLEALMNNVEIMPMINQLEIHPQFQQNELVLFCQKNNIVVESWGPLRHGKVFDIAILGDIAMKYNKSVAQLCIKWNLQRGIIPIPKASSKDRMLENINVYDFEISDDDMNLIKTLDTDDCHEDYWNYRRQKEN